MLPTRAVKAEFDSNRLWFPGLEAAAFRAAVAFIAAVASIAAPPAGGAAGVGAAVGGAGA